jgi:hypothetical protein
MDNDDDTSSNPAAEEHLPVVGEVPIDDNAAPSDPADISTHSLYQDDLDTDDNKSDPIMDEETDDPTEELGVPVDEFKDELDKYDFDDSGNDDDMREAIEDRDEGDNNSASTT